MGGKQGVICEMCKWPIDLTDLHFVIKGVRRFQYVASSNHFIHFAETHFSHEFTNLKDEEKNTVNKAAGEVYVRHVLATTISIVVPIS